jgi:hypothetical protein
MSHQERWLRTAKEQGATHIIVVCDTFDYEDYPVYVLPHQSLEDRKVAFDGCNMQKIMEVITMD